MIQHTPSIICDFHFPVDFRFDIPFPHIFWFLHQNRVGIVGFTLTKLSSVGDEEKAIPSCLDTRSPMIAPPVLLQSAFCALKKTDWPKLDRFNLLVLDVSNARRVSAEFELQLESQSEPMGLFGINTSFSIGFWNGLGPCSSRPMTNFSPFSDFFVFRLFKNP